MLFLIEIAVAQVIGAAGGIWHSPNHFIVWFVLIFDYDEIGAGFGSEHELFQL